jgi:hypothetical protein
MRPSRTNSTQGLIDASIGGTAVTASRLWELGDRVPMGWNFSYKLESVGQKS